MKSCICTLLMALTAVMGVLPTQAEKVMRPKIKEMTLWSDEKLVNHSVAMDSRDPHINITFNVLQELHNMDLHVESKITRKLNPDYFLNVNATVNLCSILNYSTKSPLGALIAGYLSGYGHIMQRCPITKGLYYLHKFWIPEDATLSTLSEIDFDINFLAYHVDASKQKTLIINDHFSGEVVVHDVRNVKRGLLAFLPRVPGG